MQFQMNFPIFLIAATGDIDMIYDCLSKYHLRFLQNLVHFVLAPNNLVELLVIISNLNGGQEIGLWAEPNIPLPCTFKAYKRVGVRQTNYDNETNVIFHIQN